MMDEGALAEVKAMVAPFTAAELPREGEEKLRDLVVGLAGAFRHEERLRWAAEQSRDRAEKELEEAKQDAARREGEHKKASGEAQALRVDLAQATRRVGQLEEALGAAGIEVPAMPAWPAESGEARFNRERYGAAPEGLGAVP